MQYRKFLSFIVLVLLTLGLGYRVEQSDFSKILLLYFPFFFLYLYLYQKVKTDREIQFFTYAGIFLRFLLLFSIPNLSDDIYRFIWDGRLIVYGINPFDHLPREIMGHGPAIPGITPELFELLNSPDYYTVYPPVNQGIFALAALIAPKSFFGSVLVVKVFLFCCEIGNLALIKKLLRKFGLPVKRILLYALNPLLIIEICGNVHFEGAMIFFLLAGIYFLWQKNRIGGAAGFALSIASKLLPLMFLPFLIRRLGTRGGFRFFAVLGILLLLLFLPLLNGVFLPNLGNSLDLYFRRFEFNASLYFIVRWVGYQFAGYNLIAIAGPVLGLLTFSGIVFMTWRERDLSYKHLFPTMLAAISLYLFLSTTVHPWYVGLPVALCLFTRYRYPIVWSGAVFLTYCKYGMEEWYLWLVALEYFIVFGFLAYEMRKYIFDKFAFLKVFNR